MCHVYYLCPLNLPPQSTSNGYSSVPLYPQLHRPCLITYIAMMQLPTAEAPGIAISTTTLFRQSSGWHPNVTPLRLRSVHQAPPLPLLLLGNGSRRRNQNLSTAPLPPTKSGRSLLVRSTLTLGRRRHWPLFPTPRCPLRRLSRQNMTGQNLTLSLVLTLLIMLQV